MRSHNHRSLKPQPGIFRITRLGLVLDFQRMRAETLIWRGATGAADTAKALAGVKATRAWVMTIRPFIVSWRVENRRGNLLDEVQLLCQNRIRAGAATGFRVADMDDEFGRGFVDSVDQCLVERITCLGRAVGHVPEDHQIKGLRRGSDRERGQGSGKHPGFQHQDPRWRMTIFVASLSVRCDRSMPFPPAPA